MKAIRLERLDQKHKPCETSDDHSFIKCLEEFKMRQAGCQPPCPWRRFSIVELDDDWTSLSNYSDNHEKVSTVVREEIIKTTKCKPPCALMEYKIS